MTSNKTAAQALRDRLKALVSGKRSAGDACEAADGVGVNNEDSGTEKVSEQDENQEMPQKRLKTEEAAEPPGKRDGVKGPATVKQEHTDHTTPGGDGTSASAKDGTGAHPDVAAFWAKLAVDAGTKAAQEGKQAPADADEPAEAKPQPTEGPEAAGPRQDVDDEKMGEDVAPVDEKVVMEDGAEAVAVEDEVLPL